MATLQFTPSTEQTDMLEATFTAKDTNVLQYHISSGAVPSANAIGSSVANVFIYARISADMPWVLVKAIVSAPVDLIARIDVPADVTVRITTNATAIEAAVFTA